MHLKNLDIGYNNITGALPSEIGRLSKLQVLYLRENMLTGSLPDGVLHNLTELRYLMLQRNGLSGGVPTEIGRLSAMKRAM